MEFASAVKSLPCYEILVVFVVTIRLQHCYEFTIHKAMPVVTLAMTAKILSLKMEAQKSCETSASSPMDTLFTAANFALHLSPPVHAARVPLLRTD
jgi:hypothetical protein